MFQVNKAKLQKAIKEAEANGPLKNLSVLWVKAAAIYNAMPKVPEPITFSVVALRAKAFKLKYVTKPGKKGSGAVFGAGRPKGPRVKKADKFKASPIAQQALEALKELFKDHTDDSILAIIAKIEAGSRSAAVKLKCIDCMGMQKAEVKRCTVFHCPLYLFRPYKEGEPLPEEADLAMEDAIA